MTILNWFESRLGVENKSKSSYLALLFVALLLPMQNLCAQQSSQTSGWDIKNSARSEAPQSNDILMQEPLADQEPSANQEHSANNDSLASEDSTAETNSALNDNETGVVSELEGGSQQAPELLISEQDTFSEEDLISEESSIEQELLQQASSDQVPLKRARGDSADELLATVDQPQQPIRPVLNLDPQLRDDLQTQFQKIRERLETDEAFNQALGEDYLSYGLLLKRAGRLNEARAMFVDALHIAKVNHGVYSIEQTPALRALFETNYLLGEPEDFEDNLKRIIWLETKYPAHRSEATYELVLDAGNYFVDLFLYRPIAGELGLSYLDKANKYFSYAIQRYANKPLDERLPPYGELALVNLLRSKIEVKYETQPSAYNRSRQQGVANFEQNSQSFLIESFSRGELYLKKYLLKAKAESNKEQIVRALLSLADVNMLFVRKVAAIQYYQLAWLEAQDLAADHELVIAFDQPVELPSFNYAHKRREIKRRDESVYVPLIFNVQKTGRVTKVKAQSESQAQDVVFKRARRAARRLIFRPAFEQGKMVDTLGYQHNVRVLVKKESEG